MGRAGIVLPCKAKVFAAETALARTTSLVRHGAGDLGAVVGLGALTRSG